MSGSLDHTPVSDILCPRERYEKDKNRQVIKVHGKSYHIINTSYVVDDAENDKHNHLHSLFRSSEKEEDKDSLIFCYSCLTRLIKGNPYYFYCNHCRFHYHKECVESPPVFRSSDHPKHPLQLLWFPHLSPIDLTQCHSCGKKNSYSLYYCSICDFMIHPLCAKNPTPFTIDNSKRHKHTLHYFPRRSALVCDVCGLEDNTDYLYVCLLCDFTVHKRCVYLPYIIKVTRHTHRLNFTPTLPHKEWINCGVCHAKINEHYGGYSCLKECVYAIHSRCAMRNDVSDGKEYEGEPEEAFEDVKMFEEEGDGIIRHLSHRHHQLQLDKKAQRVYGITKHCQACMLPFYVDDNVYECMQCDFILHEACAHSPRVKQFMLHVHPLTLKYEDSRWFTCRQCRRTSCGFRYECSIQECEWVLDILCASICEPFGHHTHPHPLFITSEQSIFQSCSICQSVTRQPFDCGKCNFFLCFHCATLPHKTQYEHDQHFLVFSSYPKDRNHKVYWCEVCEEDIDPRKGLYACDECGTALHIECLLGKDPYMKPGQSDLGWIVYVRPNTFSTRPRCIYCERRCLYTIKLEVPHLGTLCSFECFYART